jgi:hypothetical protein
LNLYGFVENDGVNFMDFLGEQEIVAGAEKCIPLAPLSISPTALARLGLIGVAVGEVIYICRTACEIPGAWEEMKRQQNLAREAEERARESKRQLDELINQSKARGKGERGKTSRPDGTGNPYKHTRPHPSDPGKIQRRDTHTGKWKDQPRPPDYPKPPASKNE